MKKTTKAPDYLLEKTARKTNYSVPLSVIDSECMCLGLRRAARAVSRRYDAALASVDLSNGQFSTLATIAAMQPVSMGALADHLAIDRTTLTAALKPLQRRGLVTAETADHDQRGREVALSAEGEALLGGAIPIWQQAQGQLLNELEGVDAGKLRRQLAKLAT